MTARVAAETERSRWDGLRLAVSLLTIVPVRGPRTVDRRTAGWAMTLAPLVGLGLGLVAGLVVFAVRGILGESSGNPMPAVAGFATLALLTGGLHLDGLADLADGFGARKDRAGTLAVLRDPAIGAFAVIALLFVVALQVSALTLAISHSHGTVSLIVSVLTGRLAVTLACASRSSAARPEGLGVLVVASVPRLRAAVVLVLGIVVAVLAGRFEVDGGTLRESLRAVVAIAVGLLVADGVRRLAIRKLGGINGDVLGALVELATMASLIVLSADLPDHLLSR